MANEDIDYQAVIADLRKRRDTLTSAIAAIEALVGGKTPGNGDDGEIPEDSTGAVDRSGDRRNDAFFKMSAAEAARKYLQERKRTATGQAITKALTAGGFTTASPNPYNTIYTALVRNPEIFVRVQKKEWGLVEWYPGRKIVAQAKKASEAAGQDEGS